MLITIRNNNANLRKITETGQCMVQLAMGLSSFVPHPDLKSWILELSNSLLTGYMSPVVKYIELSCLASQDASPMASYKWKTNTINTGYESDLKLEVCSAIEE